MAQQTAVEWLMQNIEKSLPNFMEVWREEFEQAKQMEKEQIIKAYDNGLPFEPGEQYYSETYGNNQSNTHTQMTQEQEIIVEQYMAQNDNGQEALNAMWLAEEMWEQHCAIMQAKNEMVKMSGSVTSNQFKIDFATYMMEFCRAMMEYIWLPHDVVKSITEHLNEKIDGYQYLPEKFESFHNQTSGFFRVQSVYIGVKDYIDNEVCYPVAHPTNKMEAIALTTILNHANKAGHDAVKRLSA